MWNVQRRPLESCVGMFKLLTTHPTRDEPWQQVHWPRGPTDLMEPAICAGRTQLATSTNRRWRSVRTNGPRPRSCFTQSYAVIGGETSHESHESTISMDTELHNPLSLGINGSTAWLWEPVRLPRSCKATTTCLCKGCKGSKQWGNRNQGETTRAKQTSCIFALPRFLCESVSMLTKHVARNWLVDH